MDKLVSELRRSGRFGSVILDGSFVTANPAPGDIDVIIVLPKDHDLHAELGAADYALVSRAALHRRFDLDAFVAIDGGALYERLVEFFGRVRKAYQELARAEPQRVHMIDGSGSLDEVKVEIEKWITAL